MEVGAVKQAFNNELILLKKKLNQAKIHIIHKLTRKAKTLTEKKAPEALQDKLKRKAESAIKEVLIIKKVKARDIGKFIITHTEPLPTYLNKPQIDHNKACARLLLHKVLQDKYKFIRNRFADVPIKDLFMSRQERRKLKKEAKEQQKQKKGKGNQKIINAEGNWDVEDIEMGDSSKELSYNEEESADDKESDSESFVSNEGNECKKSLDSENSEVEDDDHLLDSEENNAENNQIIKHNVGKFVKLEKPVKKGTNQATESNELPEENLLIKRVQATKKIKDIKQEKKHKGMKKKNLNEKIIQRRFKKDDIEAPLHENKVVDPFFITSSGENYMSVAEPRQPDEFKEIHKQGNRKLRRAAMFGHVPKTKPKRENFEPENRFNNSNTFGKRQDRYEKQNGFQKNNNKNEENSRQKNSFRETSFKGNSQDDTKTEKLHPSWEAKKRQSGILPFQGKKIVFDSY